MGDGYGVDKQGMGQLAGKMRECSTELGDVETPLRSRTCGSQDELGEFAAGAFNNFFGAWSQETDVIMSALGELATKLEQSAGTYSSVDSAHAGVFGRVIAQ
jgi:uncharacterized protein YukE